MRTSLAALRVDMRIYPGTYVAGRSVGRSVVCRPKATRRDATPPSLIRESGRKAEALVGVGAGCISEKGTRGI